MKLILIPIIALAICWVIKFIIAFSKERKFSFNKLVWEWFWAGKFPSTHSALLSRSWYLVLKYSNNQSIIIFTFIISALFLYSLLEDKKREEILEMYFSKSGNKELKKEVSDGTMRDFNGHSYVEIIAGLVIGLIISVLFSSFI
jgi:acid phosphatase family membrane protein YuiD